MAKPCVKCGGTERYKSGDCKACGMKRSRRHYRENKEQISEYQRRHYQKNKEQYKEKTRRWRQENQEQQKENSRRWAKDNPEKIRENSRRWKQANPEKKKESDHLYRQNHAEEIKERQKRWKQSHPEKAVAYTNRRRSLKKGAISEPYDFKAICNHYGNKCLACGHSDLPLTRDHIIPLTKGGSDTPDNIQPLCGPCNSKKHNSHQTDYRPDKGPKLPRQLSFWRK